jgi:3-oxoadipate enol-lactonase
MKVIANGIGQYYERYGAGPPLVLIHALGLDHRLWEPLISGLAARNTVYAYDVRGHGQTDIPFVPFTLADFADDLAGLLDALGIESAHLAGISMGGIIAQEFAVTWPFRVRSLVLADTTSEYSQDGRRALAERARIAEERGMTPLVEPTLDRWFTPDFRRDHADDVARIHQMLATAHPIGYAASCRAIASADITERLVGIHVPTTVLVGSEDTSTPPDMALKIHEYIPGSRYEIVPDAAHLTNVARPDVFTRIVLATVNEGEQARVAPAE